MKKINQHIILGEINTLRIDRITEPGLYLMAEDEEVVLLPNTYVTKQMNIDNNIEVFIYTDSEDRLVATTLSPKAMKNQFAVLEVVDIAKFGAFMNWGLPKDLFVPKNKQKSPFKIGDFRLIRIIEDIETNRLIGTEKYNEILSKDTSKLQNNQQVKLLIVAKTPLGFRVLIDEQYEGLIFENQIFENIKIGDKKVGFIKQIREDGKIDISLQPIGKDNANDINTKKILDIIKTNNGFLNITSKSDAQQINDTFGLSKKAFKRALNTLNEQNLIEIDENKIRLK